MSVKPGKHVPELLAPAGSLDAVRAAIANGADSIYLGAGRFNARDEGAQLSLEDLATACSLAHERGRRVYLTLNTLVKPQELRDALLLLADAVDSGIDAVIVQDIGLIALIRRLLPDLEIHGSTQMTVHDASGAALAHDIGVHRVVLARENTLDDIRAIHSAVPELGLESFIHGALCISYSGQCYMSGMISERSANRGSCAQSCRKDYRLFDAATDTTLDEGYLISARDLAAAEHLDGIADAGISCLKIEGRKKKPEYVATVTRTYRSLLEQMRSGETVQIAPEVMQPLVQIFSRGFTSGMYGGRDGRTYVTRTQPDNLGAVLGTVVEQTREGIVIEVSQPVSAGDGLGFDSEDRRNRSIGFRVGHVTPLEAGPNGTIRQLVHTRERVPIGWRVVRSSQEVLLQRARASFATLPDQPRQRKTRLDARVSGSTGDRLRIHFGAERAGVEVASAVNLQPSRGRSLDAKLLRDYLGRLGQTRFALAAINTDDLEPGCFIPPGELNRMRQRAVELLLDQLGSTGRDDRTKLENRVDALIRELPIGSGHSRNGGATSMQLSAEVFDLADAMRAAEAGATEIVIDPFLRHPSPTPVRASKVLAELRGAGLNVRLRTPTIVRPEDRRGLERWLALDVPLLTGHAGLLREVAGAGRDVAADYGVNCFNQHSAALLFGWNASSITLSVELTAEEMGAVVGPWGGNGFTAVVFGRPEGMTLEHCVLSAAFDREPTTCRDLCVQKHQDVRLTDPAGYTFPVATDSDCRNRLLHSRPVDGSGFLPRLWSHGIRGYRMLFNVPGLPVEEIVGFYRRALEDVAAGGEPASAELRELLGGEFTRGHFARAV